MLDPRAVADRFRREADLPDDVPVAPDRVMPGLYPVSSVLLPGLCVSALREWLERRGAGMAGLAHCRDQRLRGAVVAWKGHGLLCADLEDGEAERRFTLAHEAGHFLRDHYYPRRDLLERFGPGIAPVLDGLRLPTPEEQVDALLARTRFQLYTHLLGREDEWGGPVDAVEDDADVFACEMLAPRRAMLARFPRLPQGEESVLQVRAVLTGEYGLPPGPAGRYARRFVARFGEGVTLLHRMGLA